MIKTFNRVPADTPYIHNSGVGVNNVKPNCPALMYDDMVDFIVDGGQCESFNDVSSIGEGIYSGFLIVEFSDIKSRDKNQNQLENKFELAKNGFHAKVLDGNRQIPESVGSFEIDGKGYSIIFPKNGLTDETIPEKGVYKGVIVNPELYFSEEAQAQVTEGADAAKRILDQE